MPKTALSPQSVLTVVRLGEYIYLWYMWCTALTSKGTINPSVPTLRNFEGLAVTVVRKVTPLVNALPSPKERVSTAVKKGMSLVSFV